MEKEYKMSTKLEIKEEFLQQAKILARGAEILPGGVNELAIKLQKSKETNTPLRVKLGMDPTRPDLHLGHSVVMRKLREFQKFGHQIVLIVGGATAMVGDPSGKSAERNLLDEKTLRYNQECIKNQLMKFLDFSDAPNSAVVLNNYDWLSKLTFIDFLILSLFASKPNFKYKLIATILSFLT